MCATWDFEEGHLVARDEAGHIIEFWEDRTRYGPFLIDLLNKSQQISDRAAGA